MVFWSNSLSASGAIWLTLISSSRGQACTGVPTVLLQDNDTIDQGESFQYPSGFVLTQQFGGNLQIYTGEIGNLECLIWESGVCDIPSSDAYYSTILQGDGHVITKKYPNDGSNQVVSWKSNVFVPPPPVRDWYFFVTCDGKVGVSLSANGEVPIWSAQGNLCGVEPPPPAKCERTVVIREGQLVSSLLRPIVSEGGRSYIEQTDNGSLIIREGRPNASELGRLLWQTCTDDASSQGYNTYLQEDSNFLTRDADDSSIIVWKRDGFDSGLNGDWELALECDAAGQDFSQLVITDSSNNIVWKTDLFNQCIGGDPVCETASIVLGMDDRLEQDETRGTDGYSLQQLATGELLLLDGFPGSINCELWRSDPIVQSHWEEFYSVMQNDGNLVTYGPSSAAVWSSGSSTGEGTYNLVVDDCSEANPVLAIYEGNPVNEANARRVWFNNLDQVDCS